MCGKEGEGGQLINCRPEILCQVVWQSKQSAKVFAVQTWAGPAPGIPCKGGETERFVCILYVGAKEIIVCFDIDLT